VISLRYFNPGGCHSSGKIGDYPSKCPGNLFSVIQEVILGRRAMLYIFGNDYNTIDGSGVRDYIHVVDLGIFFVILA
jgi:UDP-glucose 4-epimerase